MEHGDFHGIEHRDESFDLAWSQDAFVHCERRARMLRDIFRILEPGGHLVFTDLMKREDIPDNALRQIYHRIPLKDMCSIQRYREMARYVGFREGAISPCRRN